MKLMKECDCMKCPYCNSEMKDGYIQSARGTIFSIEPHKVQFWPNKSIGEFTVPSQSRLAPTCAAYHCPRCKKIILDYAKKAK